MEMLGTKVFKATLDGRVLWDLRGGKDMHRSMWEIPVLPWKEAAARLAAGDVREGRINHVDNGGGGDDGDGGLLGHEGAALPSVTPSTEATEVSHDLGGAEGEAVEVEGELQQEEAPVAERGDAEEEVQQPTPSPTLPPRRTTQGKRGAVRGGAKEGAAKERPKRAAHPRDFLKVCELARVHMFLNRPTLTMAFYPSSDDKTHGVCSVLDRLPHSFACLALAADKSRRVDLNKTLSEWKTRAAARERDIALPKLGLFRDERDASSLWAPEKERSIEKIRERIGLGADPPESLVLTSWATDRNGMPFASRAFATRAKAAFKPKKAGLVMTLKVYHLAWLEHVVSDSVLCWEERKGRLSNSASGNAHVMDGLKDLVKEALERAIRIRNPEYDAEREA
ncbi:unnamed protein product [Closterium sp. Yama58-4]|nr:unnamed protein product [Closterium sp. Yama58-4]